MNHRTFTRLLSEGPVEVEIIKKSQIYGHFLTNRSDHPLASYPVINDTTLHLDPGDRLKVISAIAPHFKQEIKKIKLKNFIFFPN